MTWSLGYHTALMIPLRHAMLMHMVSISDMRAHLRERHEQRQHLAATRAQRLLKKMPAARRLLTDEYGVQRALLFGSLAIDRATPESDVDIAVEGLAPQQYFHALAALMAVLEAPVDLVLIEEASSSLRAAIEQQGRAL